MKAKSTFRKSALIWFSIALLSLWALGCGEEEKPTTPEAPSAPEAGEGITDVAIQNFAFNPATVTVSVGDTMRWTNKDNVSHTTTSETGVWDSGSLSRGKSFSFQFKEAGEFPYLCSIHPSMRGKVVVKAKESEGG